MCGCAAHYDKIALCSCQCPSHETLRILQAATVQQHARRLANGRLGGRQAGPLGFGSVYIPPTEPVLLIDVYGQELGRASVHSNRTVLRFEVCKRGRATSLYSIHDDFLFDFDPRELEEGDVFNVNIYTRIY